jgi:spore germination cell wall hydrolase CwlJ-like protein
VLITQLDNQTLLRACIILEAGGESFLGKLAVGCVIRERVVDKRWPVTWPGVILQPKQFSCFNNIALDSDLEDAFVQRAIAMQWKSIFWRECQLVAFGIINNYVRDVTGGANHYHTEDVHPRWADTGKCVFREGRHLFYRL